VLCVVFCSVVRVWLMVGWLCLVCSVVRWVVCLVLIVGLMCSGLYGLLLLIVNWLMFMMMCLLLLIFCVIW